MEVLKYYLVAINLFAIIITVYDKWASKYYSKKRIRESSLILIGLLGGSLAMYISMLIIRHKTRKKKFALGLALIILGQAYILYRLGFFQLFF